MNYIEEKERITNKILFAEYQLRQLEHHKFLHRKKIKHLKGAIGYYTQYLAYLDKLEGEA